MAADVLTRVGDVLDAVLAISEALAIDLADQDPEQRIDVPDGPPPSVLYERALIAGMTDGPDNPRDRPVNDRAQGMGRRKTQTVPGHSRTGSSPAGESGGRSGRYRRAQDK